MDLPLGEIGNRAYRQRKQTVARTREAPLGFLVISGLQLARLVIEHFDGLFASVNDICRVRHFATLALGPHLHIFVHFLARDFLQHGERRRIVVVFPQLVRIGSHADSAAASTRVASSSP